MSKIQLDCMDTWKLHLPEYKLMLWDETNIDMNHPFISFAAKYNKWAFVSDYVRLLKIYEFGGVYMDTDMFVIKSLNKLLQNECFFGAQDKKLINAAIIGAQSQSPFIYKCLEYYNKSELSLSFINLAIPRVITRFFVEEGDYLPRFEGDYLIKNNVKVYATDYFYPMPFDVNAPFDKKFKEYATEQTYALHLWEGSWIEYSDFQLIRKRMYFKALCKIDYKKLLKITYIKKLFRAFQDSIFI